jgi:serine protease Do
MPRPTLGLTRLGRALLLLAVALPVGLAVAQVTQTPPAPSAAPAPPPPLSGALPESYPWVRLAEALTPAVVHVRVTGEPVRMRERLEEWVPERFRRFLPPEFPGEREPGRGPMIPRGIGSGFIVEADGYVVTNHHVAQGAKAIEVTLSDGRKFPAKLVGSDPETDLALLKIDATGLPTIPLGSSGALRVGEPVMAIGNPFGLDHTVTVGIISAKGRVIGAGRFDDFLQTDAAINPGNSGGPIISTRGEAVGIATAIASRSGGFQGIGFAIPSDLARPILGQLRSAGRITRGWLGVSIQPVTRELVRSFGLAREEGVLVASVIEGSPAAQAGLRPGDVILKYDGRTLTSPRELSTLVAGTKVGQTVELQVHREGSVRPIKVTIGDLESRHAAAPAEPRLLGRLGFELRQLTPELARRLGLKAQVGVVVTEVEPGSPAAAAGLAEGDVIREVNRTPVTAVEDVERGLRDGSGAAHQVLLRVQRGDSARYVVVDAG